MSEQTNQQNMEIRREDKIPWSSILNREYNIIKLEEMEDFLTTYPSEELARQFAQAYEEKNEQPARNHFGIHNAQKFAESEVLKIALDRAFDKLREMRLNGIGSHAVGHANSFLFFKLLDMLEANTKSLGDHSTNKINKVFQDIFDSNFEVIKKAFQPIHDVLSASVSFDEQEPKLRLVKKEKQLLLRALWDDFVDKWDRFARIDWGKEFQIYYAQILYYYKNYKQEE